MKNLTIIYCGEDADAGVALAAKLRAENTDNKIVMHSSEYFVGAEVYADRVIIMPDVPFFRAMPIKDAYPNAEYNPPDEFSPKQVGKAFDEFAAQFHHGAIQSVANSIESLVAERPEVIAANTAAKRPRGRPRKVIAA